MAVSLYLYVSTRFVKAIEEPVRRIAQNTEHKTPGARGDMAKHIPTLSALSLKSTALTRDMRKDVHNWSVLPPMFANTLAQAAVFCQMKDETRLSFIRMINDQSNIQAMMPAINAFLKDMAPVMRRRGLQHVLSMPLPKEVSHAFATLSGGWMFASEQTFGNWLHMASSILMAPPEERAQPALGAISATQAAFQRVFQSIKNATQAPIMADYDDDDEPSFLAVLWFFVAVMCTCIFAAADNSAMEELAKVKPKERTFLQQLAHNGLAGPDGDWVYRQKLAKHGHVDSLTKLGALADIFDMIAAVSGGDDD